VYAARRTKDDAVTITVINKDLHGACELKLDVGKLKGKMRVWCFDQDHLDKVSEVKDAAGDVAGTIKMTLPAASASMLAIVP
jgi:hypothetical protein